METPSERRDRVSALVQEKYPEFQTEEDRLEAIDALAENQLELG